MAYLWVVLGVAAAMLIVTVVGLLCGRGHLGVDKSPDEYLDELESIRKNRLF
jgi:hypothetical protein